MKKLFAIAAVGGLAAASMAVAPAAQAKTVKACVKKSDGSVKFINKKNKKCKKGWKLKTWNSAGPQGPAGPGGPAGPNWTVKDKNGVTLGTFSGLLQHRPASDGLRHHRRRRLCSGTRMDGLLGQRQRGLLFTNNGCTDAVIFAATTTPDLKAVSEVGRWQRSHRVPGDGCPDGQCLEDRGDHHHDACRSRPTSLFKKNSDTGACAAATHPAGFYVPLTPATAPVVAAPGPLQIVR